ncbi:MAG: glutamate--tRNA ligase family protein [Alphaproteobacteria bacterium]|nr:glutamate--tRNA ligase family protein [Alphaproteobacteria bacterium]
MRNGISKELIERALGAAPKYTIAELEKKFPPRDLPAEAMVSRWAPSPTGHFHTGNLYPAIVDKKLAQQSGGVFMLRLEDTDTAREVEGAVEIIVNSLALFGLSPDEGAISETEEKGAYGPYKQSERKDFYHSVAAELLAEGKAYPCFMSSAEMDAVREKQRSANLRPGIYGEFARDRNLSEAEITAHLDAGKVPSIRLYSTANYNEKIYCKDAIRGSIAFPQYDDDIVLIKSNDKLPTYHFAHLVDDHFMRTTHVFRANEWLPSLPLHVQLFDMMGWEKPVYFHHATIDILDPETGNRRKLSKSKDREAGVNNLLSDGWAPEAIDEYVFNIIDSSYEDEKKKKPALTIWDHPIRIKKLSPSGALFDIKKLEWWAREYIATLPIEELTRRVVEWADKYSPEWSARIKGQGDYLRGMLAIERDNPKSIRKDFYTWKQTLEQLAFFWDDLFTPAEYDKAITADFLATFNFADDKDSWWSKIQAVATARGIKPGEAAMALRIGLTGRAQTPDLYSVIKTMGEARVRKRLA